MSRHELAARSPAPGSLFHPVVDFLLVGGLSIATGVVVLLVLRDVAGALPAATMTALVLSHVINFPHFAHSYQLLYSGMARRLRSPETTRLVRLRYLWAGLIVPAALAAALATAFLAGDVRALGYGANAMLFFVGWHYVKQGYGVLIVLSAIRRVYYGEWEKRWLRTNGYAVWIASWLAINVALRDERYFGVPYQTLGVPAVALDAAVAWAAITTLAVAVVLGRRVAVARAPVSWSGLAGYGCALYLWLFAFIEPVYAALAPMFHSLQYLAMVWRYELNKLEAESPPPPHVPGPLSGMSGAVRGRFAAFVAIGVVGGWLGFIGLPTLLQRTLRPDVDLWGPSVYMFMFAILINVHHYFIDNVIWRRDNGEVRRFLFAPRA